MIDNALEVDDLLDALQRHMPLQAYAMAPLVHAARQNGAMLRVNDPVRVDTVLYLGDDGGIACSLEIPGSRSVMVVSITHLRIDGEHPLAERVQAYQIERSRRIAGPSPRDVRKARTRAATKLKQQKAGVRVSKTEKEDLTPRFLLGCESWGFGDFQRAAASFREVLQRNPKDPHFCRYWLASCLFQLAAFDELDQLLQQQDDHSGVWRFAQALSAFRRYGDSDNAQLLLAEADHLEPGFEHYLLQDEVVYAGGSVRFDAGADERAAGCARLFLPAWRAVPGAASWARRVLRVPPTRDDSPTQRRFPQDELQALPQGHETWQVGLIRSDDKPKVNTGADPTPLWMFGVVNPERREVRTVTIIDQPLNEANAWSSLLPSFLHPMDGQPARPAALVVGRRELVAAWKPLLAKIGVGCRYQKNPQPVGQLLQAMQEMAGKQDLPDASKIDIREYPQVDAVWQADFIRSPAWVVDEERGTYRPWSVLVLEKSNSRALLTSHTPGDPTPEMLLELLVRTMARPGAESARRPRMVELSDSDCYDYLRPRLEAAGVACKLVDELSEFNEFCLRLAESFDESEKCALATGRGVTRAHMESFYEAASGYFREAPWRRVPGEVPIEIRCDNPAVGTRYAVVLGRTGVQLGLCIYDDWEITCRMLSGYANPDENRALAVCYDEPQIMSAVDLQLIERLGWPIATPEAWPAVMRLLPRRMPGSPNAEELVYLDACLRAIPDFLKKKAGSQTYQLSVGSHRMQLHLAWAS